MHVAIFLKLSIIVLLPCQFHGYSKKNIIQFDRVNFLLVNETLMVFQAHLDYYNRTTKTFNFNISYGISPPKENEVHINLYIFQSNSYRLSAIQMKVTMYTMMNYGYFDIKRYFDSFDPPMRWPVLLKTLYTQRNFYPDMDNFPRYLPEGKFKVLVEYHWAKTKLKYTAFEIFGTVKYNYRNQAKSP